MILFNSFRNLAGAAVPAAVSIFTVPYIVRAFGDEGYGAFMLISSIIGYFALLDINVTSSSVKYVAEHNARGEREELLQVISFGGLVYALIGIIGSSAIYLLAEPFAIHVFSIAEKQRPIIVDTLQVAAFGFFLNQLQVYLNSIPQSLQRYDITAALEIAFGTGVPLGTVGLLWMGYGLWEAVAFRVWASALNVLLLLLIIRRLVPNFRWAKPSRSVARKVASFSGFAYLSRIAAVTYNHGDKLIIGALVNMAELAFYTVPSTLVNRLLGLTFRLGSVLYPVASELDALGDRKKLGRIYLSATRYLTYANTFLVMIISLFSYQILFWWIGEDFATQGRWIMVTMAFAMLIDSYTNLPSLFMDGLGHPQRTGLFALVRAVLGLGLTLLLTQRMGVFGAALSHLIASILLSVAFLLVCHRTTIPVSLWRLVIQGYFPSCLIVGICGIFVYVIGMPSGPDFMRFLLSVAAVTALYAGLGFFLIVEPGHRAQISRYCHGLFGRGT